LLQENDKIYGAALTFPLPPRRSVRMHTAWLFISTPLAYSTPPLEKQAWKRGDIARVGAIFREDGHGLRDVYEISGPELESMCDIVRGVPGVLGERMLGGGDKGAAGAIVLTKAVDAVRKAVETGYPASRPEFRK